VKGSPQSPPGKGRARERSRRSGKGERGNHQLYRLSIAGARPNPTIGIAYPQQKVTPPKKPEVNRGPVGGTYRFHVPPVPQHEADLQQDDVVAFGRCFPEAASSRTSSNYTSQPAPRHGPKGQPPAAGIPLKSPGTNGQLRYLEFQANGADSWPSPEKSFAGASYGISVQKPSSFPEAGKAGAHGLGALPCQYPFQLLHDPGKEPYRGDAGSQEYLDMGLATGQLAHGTFAFHSSCREWQEEALSGGSYETVSAEGRLYGLPAPAPFLHPPPAPHHGPLPCCKGRSEHPTDPNGALPSSGAIDPNPSTFQENQAVFPSSLHSPSVPKPVGQRQASVKDSVPAPRLLVQSSPLRRNMPPNSLSQVHFPSKAYCSSPAGSASAGSVPFETSIPTTAPTHPRLVQAWEGATKAFSPMDQNSAPYSNPVGNQFSFECQSGPEQRQHRQKNPRMPWQQIHVTSAMPGQNRLELSRHISSQKLPFPLGTSEWQGGGNAQKVPPVSNSPGYRSKKLLSGESLGVQRGDPNSTGAFSFESGKEPGSPACESRSKALFYSVGQAGPPPPPLPSRSSSGSALVLPPSALVAASPCESPLPSPVPNPTCGSTCSSLSPMSSSPLNPSFEDSQMSGALTPSPFFQHPCHPKDGSKTFHPSDVLTSSSLHYHPPDSVKSFHFPPDALKDDNLLKCTPASPFHKPSVDVAKGCSDGLDGEQPPPPYSSHHLLANSLSSASLDQLDVLLTCKQCDQNYSNLSSFLQHRQFCASHPAPQGEGKDAPRAAEGRKALSPEPHKPPSLGLSPDPQAHLLALNKSDDFLLDGESKSEGKEDALKGGLFNGLTTSSLPLTASDLDIDDAKLDSLITEALNGLGYQSDNPEIDSSFIDVFADEELTGMKAAGGGMSHKVKEALASESKSKQVAAEEKAAGQPKASSFFEDGHPGEEQVKRGSGKNHLHKGRARRLAAQEPDPGAAGAERMARLQAGRKNSIPPATTSTKSTSSPKHAKKLSQEPPTKNDVEPSVATKSSKPPRFSMKEMKKRKPRSGTWSKELIHKIVQQKNKLHKLQVKSSKQAQYSFTKKHQGKSERTKEKDPVWSYSRKRNGQKRETQEHGGAPSQEDGEKGGCASRVRRRSSQSSTGSNPSESVPSEMGTILPRAGGAGGEKGGVQRRRHSGSPAHVPRIPPSLPEDGSPRKSQKGKEDFPRGSRQLGSAKPLVASSRTCQSAGPDAAEMDCAKEEPLPPPQERQLPSAAVSGRSPVRASCKEGAEDPKGAAKHTSEAGEPILESQDSPELPVANQRHQFAPFAGDTLKYHTGELIAPPQGGNEAGPGNVSAAYSEVGIKYLKAQGLCDGRKDYPVPVAPYGGDTVGMMLTPKAPDPYVSGDNAFFDPKSLPGHYEDNLFTKPPAMGSSHMEDMYLCRDDINTGSFEQKHASIPPYTTETPQGKVSSPLSFDSSSIFGELPVSGFDPPLYEGVSVSKDGYVTAFTCPANPPSKPLAFEQPYPPFMPEKDWSLMEEVAPMLPEDMTQFHSLAVEKPLAKKFPEEGPVPTNQLSLPLPDRLTDYNVAFMNNISDDELEIKRLVTELESQLQTSKLDAEASTTLPKPEPHAHLRGAAAERFPPLPVERETGREKGVFLAEELGGPSLCGREGLGGEKPAVVSTRGDYERPREAWPCPVELGSLEVGICAPAPHAAGRFCAKDGNEQLQERVTAEERDLGKMENGSSSQSLPGSHTPDRTEAPVYADPMTKSPPAVTNSMFSKTLEAAEGTKDPLPALPCQHGAKSFPVPRKGDESFADAAELEKFDTHLPNPKPEFGFQQGPTPALDLAFSPHIREVPDAEERPLSKPESPSVVKTAVDLKGDGGGSTPMEEMEERKSPTTTYPAPDKAIKQKVLLFEMLSLPKESNQSSGQMLASQETSANPLQQLQLFVARTVKSNEEELLMPCFPMLLAPNHPSTTPLTQQEQKEENNSALEGENRTYCPAQGDGNLPTGANVENTAAPAKEVELFSGGHEQLESLGATGSYPTKQSTIEKPEPREDGAELQHLDRAEPGDVNIPAVSPECNDLVTPKNTAVTPPLEQRKEGDQLVEEGGENRAGLELKNHEQSRVRGSLLEEEAPGRAAVERLERSQGGQGAQPLHSAPVSPTSPPGPSEEGLHQDHCLVTEREARVKVPREGNGVEPLNGCHYTGESSAGLPLMTNFSHPKRSPSGGVEGGETPSFSTQTPHEKDSSQPCSPPFIQKSFGKDLPKSAGAVLSSSQVQETQVGTVTGMVINSIPPEAQGYPIQPTMDLLPTREREANLNRENKLENCSDDGNKHQSEPESSPDRFVVQQLPGAISRGPTQIGDLSPAELNHHEFSEVAEVRLGLSKTTESGRNGLKGEKVKSHEAGEAVLSNMDQGEDNTSNSTSNPSQNELPSDKKPNGLPVTCDICSASFRSKPGLTRHKAVKHQVRNSGVPPPNKTPRSTLIPADRTSKGAQKVPRRGLKASVREKSYSSQVPTTNVDPSPKKTRSELEKEPSTQMQEVVSRVLSDLSVISFEMSQELHRTRVLQREMKVKGTCSETSEVMTEKLDLGQQAKKGEKGRRSQTKDPGEVNSNSEKKLSRKVRRRKAKVFPSRNEPTSPSELEKNTGPPPPALLSSSLPRVMEGLHESGGCISTEEQDRPNSSQHPEKAPQSPCAAELAEDLGDRMGSSKETAGKESVTGTITCPRGVEDPSRVEDMQACQKWASGFVKHVEKGLDKVGRERHRGSDGVEKVDAEAEDGPAAGGGAGNQDGAPQGPMAPAEEVAPLETCESETTQKAPGQGALQTVPGTSPPPEEPKQWAKSDVALGRERCVESTAVSDLQSLFDDDSTFSQLFPRDDQFIRRKCTRVYGKRSKKPKPITEVNLHPAGTIDLFTIRLASDLSESSSFCVTREAPCEYETISVDDALMLNMCHGGKAKSGDAAPSESKNIALRLDCEKTDQGKEDIDLEDNMLTFLCQNSQVDNIPGLNIWGSLEKEGESLSAEDVFEPLIDLEDEHSLRETTSELPNPVEEPYDGKSVDSDSPEFHTIDIEMLNAKLKMRDMCFFSPCEDLPGHGEDNAVSFKPKPGQHSKHRSKLEDGKLGKTRNEITIKAKDKQYKCKVCFQWFLTLGELDFHKLSHNPSPPPTCYMCVQRKFSSREQLRDHLKEKHAKNKAGLWACGMCLKEISDVWMYNEHLREHATQFARKGQAQKSVMGLPACFSEDSAAVTHFLNTIMYRKSSRSSRHAEAGSKHVVSRESKSPKELPLEQEAKAMKDPLESSVRAKPPAPSSSKASCSPSPEHVAKSEGTSKPVPMHPDCKDPSRDCHHCGKQFPKPFKLQRHLVVHSLQKIYLCHRCPMFYQETKELRNHLSQEHGIVEEQEIKHTTLYACELCADVMHVIKKSFICSMCNYTFSKKEQYDRHMEKHLAGSSKTFKFRGVMRPGVASREGREKVKEDGSLREGMPPSKKRKVAHHGSSLPRSSPVHLDPTGDLQLIESSSPSPQASADPFPTAPCDPGAPQPSMKTEDIVGDFSDLLAEMEKSQFDTLPPPPCLSPSLPRAGASSPELGHITALSMEELEKGAFDGKPLPFLDSHDTGNKDDHAAGVLENPNTAANTLDGIPFLQLPKKISELPSPQVEIPLAKETHRTLWGNPSDASSWEGASKATSPEVDHQQQPLKDKASSPTLNRATKDSVPQKKTTGSQPSSEVAAGIDSPSSSAEEGQQPILGREKAFPEAKDGTSNTKDQGVNPSKSTSHQPRGEAASNAVRHGHVEPSKATSKLHPKRRKEHKSLSHRSSSCSRENMEGDGKKKKTRTPCSGRSESTSDLKHTGWSNAEASALSPGRRETHCNKLVPKPKTGTQLKKLVLDTYNQKKEELRHANGDLKRRKAILGKSLHQVLAKGPPPSPRGSLHSPRVTRGAKPGVSGSYRTAESQNNLLSQLFGQKLTSFKIPLRRDTSE
ncbi:ZN469 protein, partial [Heliornis fulica]|nr:ZN469 protein [Heliornis fulica]